MNQGQKTLAVYEWITEAHGLKTAHDWLWSCTPYPCGDPNDSMLEEGLAVATGELPLNELRARIEVEMTEQMAEYNARMESEHVDG